jgi:predicted RNA-binding protein YlxR (DUF448 family)
LAPTLASAARERRDIVTGQVMDETRLIRFVEGPDAAVVPDLARKLPGRGLWVAADRVSVETAARKGLFSKAARKRLSAPADLAARVEALLAARLLASLGLARKAGLMVMGFEKVREALAGGRVVCLIEARDGAEDGRGKLLALMRAIPKPPILLGVFDGMELSLALGAENVIHSALLAGRGADRWTRDIERLAGFRPLFPETWLEGP